MKVIWLRTGQIYQLWPVYINPNLPDNSLTSLPESLLSIHFSQLHPHCSTLSSGPFLPGLFSDLVLANIKSPTLYRGVGPPEFCWLCTFKALRPCLSEPR